MRCLQNQPREVEKAVGLFHKVLDIIQVQCNDNKQPYITTTEIRQRAQQAFDTEITAEQVQRAIFHWNKHKNSPPLIVNVDRGKWTTVNKEVTRNDITINKNNEEQQQQSNLVRIVLDNISVFVDPEKKYGGKTGKQLIKESKRALREEKVINY